jgi:Ni/Co efflux regulator RcnB
VARVLICLAATAALAASSAALGDNHCRNGHCPPAGNAQQSAPQRPVQQQPVRQNPVIRFQPRPQPPAGGTSQFQQGRNQFQRGPIQPQRNPIFERRERIRPGSEMRRGPEPYQRSPNFAHPNNGVSRIQGPNRAIPPRRGFRVGMGAPLRSRAGRTYLYHGQHFASFRVGRYRWPQGYAYRRYGIGYRLPPIFWIPDYYVLDYSDYGVEAPPDGFQWVRYGPDLLLINTVTGDVTNVVYGAFEESADVEDEPPADEPDDVGKK